MSYIKICRVQKNYRTNNITNTWSWLTLIQHAQHIPQRPKLPKDENFLKNKNKNKIST